MAVKDKRIVRLSPNKRIDLADARAMQENGRSEARELLQALTREYTNTTGSTPGTSGLMLHQNRINMWTGASYGADDHQDIRTGYGESYWIKPCKTTVANDGNSVQV